MTGREIPEFDDLGDGAPPDDGMAGGAPGGPPPDWLDLDLPGEPAAAELEGRPVEPGPGRPAAPPPSNGRNGDGHGGVRFPTRRPRLRSEPASSAGERGRTESAASDAGAHLRMRPLKDGENGGEDDLMTALAAAAAAAPDGEEAALLAAALVPLALAAVGPQARAIRPALPALVKGAAGLAVWLVEEEARDLMRLLPLILEETVRALGRAAAEERPITRALAGDLLAGQTETTIARYGRPGRNRPGDGRPHRANNGTIHPRPARRGASVRRDTSAHRDGPPAWESTQWDASDEDDCCG